MYANLVAKLDDLICSISPTPSRAESSFIFTASKDSQGNKSIGRQTKDKVPNREKRHFKRQNSMKPNICQS